MNVRGRISIIQKLLVNGMCPCNPVQTRSMSVVAELPPKPQPPAESDCCDSGCTLCVKDIYEQELRIWKEECDRILLKQAPKSTLSPRAYTKCSLLNIESLIHNTNIYTFNSNGYAKFDPGQHLVLRERINGRSITRQYTPVSVPSPTDHTFKVMIKVYEKGIMTSHIKESWHEGAMIEWRGPLGVYVHQPEKYMKILMLAAGTGLAPMLNIAKSIVQDENDITSIKLLYSCKSYDELLLKNQIKELCRSWNFTSTFFLTQHTGSGKKYGYGENVKHGRISKLDVENEVMNAHSVRVLVCGTREFDDAMINMLKDIGVLEENIFKF